MDNSLWTSMKIFFGPSMWALLFLTDTRRERTLPKFGLSNERFEFIVPTQLMLVNALEMTSKVV
jgi:hypothetical protein